MMESLKRRVSVFYRNDMGLAIRRKDRLRYMLEGCLLMLLLSLFFYRSLWALPFLSPLYFLYCRERKKLLKRKYERETTMQFKDAILALAANLRSGYSVENAFKQAYRDMELLYGRESIICREFYSMIMGLGNNLILEEMLYEFGRRSGAEDIREFAEVFAAAKRNGGNLTEIIERSAAIISDKVETEKEIEVLLSTRRMEQKIMNMVPFGILFYISATSAGYFDILYHNIPGILIMTACLGTYAGAVFLSGKIVNIQI